MLTCRTGSSLVVDWLCDHSREHNAAVAWLYLDLGAGKEQSATSMLGSLLMQMVSGMERIPQQILQPFHRRMKAIDRRRLQLGDIVNILQIITYAQPTFICVDAVDECGGVQRAELLDSLKEILERSPRTRIFLTGRPHIQAEVEKRLAQRVVSVPISPTNGDITKYLSTRLGEDETPDAMDKSLEEDILKKIPNNTSEMCVGQWCLVSRPRSHANGTI